MRLRCSLFGCITGKFPCCDRCGADIYGNFIERGWLSPLFTAWWRLRRKFTRGPFFGRRKCIQCGKWYWLGYDDGLCSEECHDVWLPF